MKNYKMNFSTRILTITKDFAAGAMIPHSEEAMLLEHFQKIMPDLKVKYLTHKPSATPNRSKGLTYKKMENYINLYENSEELLERFRIVKALSQIQTNPYLYVFNWFVNQFPNYKEMPEFNNGKLHTTLIEVPEIMNIKSIA